ncbi:MAG TPA: argininosuccinate lyase [Gemmobacter sp.]|nr:argininosuccinate lyase [Gemmobacter sp.]
MRPNLARPMLALCLLGLLAACGADGEPTAPTTAAPGLTLSGGVKMGVGYSE